MRPAASLFPSTFVATSVLLALAAPPRASAQQTFLTEEGGPRLEVAARVETGALPKSVSVSPDGRRVAVCNFGYRDHDSVYLYDAETLDRIGMVEFPGNGVESVFSHDSSTLYVSNFRGHSVEVIDVETLTVRRHIPVGAHPKTLALSPDERTLYVANYFDETVSVVDLVEGREVRRLRAGERPRGLGVLSDGTLLAAAFHGDHIRSFAPEASTPGDQWTVCRFPRDIRTAPDRRSYYLTCSLGHIGFYRPEDRRRPFGLATTGRNPRSIGVSGDGRWLGVANFGSHDVSLIDTVRRTHREQDVPGARRVVGVAMHPGPGIRLYLTSWDTNELIMMVGQAPEPTEPDSNLPGSNRPGSNLPGSNRPGSNRPGSNRPDAGLADTNVPEVTGRVPTRSRR